jgi:hypothetical protein
LPYLLTDPACGHPALTAVVREHAREQAHLAAVAGYPVTVEEWETPPHPGPLPPCARCGARIAATLRVMQRARVASAADHYHVDPFLAVYAFDAVCQLHPHLSFGEVADAVIDHVIPGRVRMGMLVRYTAPDTVPDGLADLPDWRT